jgi:membrane protein YqaA with SNARE-associated domain
MKETATSVALPAANPGLFARAYAWMEGSAHGPRALWILATVATTEAFIFPLPPDIMLIPMTLLQPKRWFWLATLCTVMSALGGIVGWLIGHLLIGYALPLIQHLGQGAAYESARDFFARYGFWAIIIKGLTPIPFKIFTIAAGAVDMPLSTFFFASLIGRGIRFYVVAGVMRLAGPSIEPALKRYIEYVGWAVCALVVAGFVYIGYAHTH